MASYFQFVLRHRVLALVAMALVTAACAFALRDAYIGSSIAKLFLGESPDYTRYRALVERFGSDELLVVAYEDDDVLAPESLHRLQRVVARLVEIADIDRVQSLLDVRRVFLTGEDEFVDSFIAAMAADSELRAEALERVRSDRFASGTVLSHDGRSAAVIITLVDASQRSVESNVELIDRVIDAFVAEGHDPATLHRAGAIAVLAEVMAQTYFNISRLFPVVCVVLVLVVIVLFRSFWPVLISMGVAIVSVVWTMGIAVAFEPEVNILLASVPAVILIISFSDVIHLLSAYLLELDEPNRSQRDAIVASAQDVGFACVFTSLTTFVGFVCLSLIPTPVFRQMGIVLGLGVAIALGIAMTLVPVLLSFLPAPRRRRRSLRTRCIEWIDGALRLCERTSLAHPWLVIASSTAIFALAVAGTMRIEVENELTKRLRPSNPVRRDTDWFEKHLAGTNVLDLYIEAGGPSGVLEPEVFAAIGRLQDDVERLPGVDLVLSPVTLAREILAASLGRDSADDDVPLPRDSQDLRQLLTTIELFDPSALATLLASDGHTMRLLARLEEKGLRATHRIGTEALELAAARLGDRARVEATGISFLIGGWLDSILVGQRHALLSSFVTIALMMAVALRSLSAGVWSMLPNLLPLLVMSGWIGFTWDQVDSDTIGLAVLAIGIGVDDTIHFLVRYRLERARSTERREALSRTFRFAGRGIVMTTVILTLGFLPFALSDYFTVRILGTLLPLVLVVALVADVLLVPALCTVGWLRVDGRARSQRIP